MMYGKKSSTKMMSKAGKKDDPIKGASLKKTPIAKSNQKEVNSKMKNASKSMADAKAKKVAAEDKALRRNKRAAAAAVGTMVAGGLAMFKENKRRENWQSSRFK
jgi:hypothetical protein